jgi:hypothetical protein
MGHGRVGGRTPALRCLHALAPAVSATFDNGLARDHPDFRPAERAG